MFRIVGCWRLGSLVVLLVGVVVVGAAPTISELKPLPVFGAFTLPAIDRAYPRLGRFVSLQATNDLTPVSQELEVRVSSG